MQDFKGRLYHSGAWDWEKEELDPSFRWSEQKVGVIGNGSSAVQIVPTLQKRAKHVKNFGRSKSESALVSIAHPSVAVFWMGVQGAQRFATR
jgi:cation diffusion facilitator CzcD-associated flavoprotein CzcO